MKLLFCLIAHGFKLRPKTRSNAVNASDAPFMPRSVCISVLAPNPVVLTRQAIRWLWMYRCLHYFPPFARFITTPLYPEPNQIDLAYASSRGYPRLPSLDLPRPSGFGS